MRKELFDFVDQFRFKSDEHESVVRRMFDQSRIAQGIDPEQNVDFDYMISKIVDFWLDAV